MSDEREDTTIYKVVVNHEEQYSIWPADRENAPGWINAGKTGCRTGMPGPHQRGLDRYASVKPAEKGWKMKPQGKGEPA